MKKSILCIITLFCVASSFSQSKSFKISGTIISLEEDAPLEAATIHIESIKDSTLVTYTISDKDGKFTLQDKTGYSSLNLFVSYVGYETFKKTIDLNKDNIDLAQIVLKTDSNALDEIVIKSVAPITIKKDTLEFNAKSFKTKKDANVEDLLKKLPGFELDLDGKITINGKDVDKVLVNGESFFGGDPTVATRNLTKEMIQKIQVVDTKSKSEAFAGEEGSQTKKTINLTVKKNDYNGFFGYLGAGIGTDDRYEVSGMLNSFKSDTQISILAGSNNINSPGFSNRGFRGQRGGAQGGGNGITTSKTTGVNYNSQLNEKLRLSGNYLYSGSDTDNQTITKRENILPDSRFFSNSTSNSFNENDSHRAGLDFEIKVDSTLFINISPSFNFAESTGRSSREEASLNELNDSINKSSSASFNKTINKSFANRLDITKRFGNNGAFLRLNMSNNISDANTDRDQKSKTDFFEIDPNSMENTVQNSIVRNQIVDSNTESNSLDLGITYRLPLISKKLFLDTSYEFSKSIQKNITNTYDFDEVNQEYNDFINEDLSSDFKYTNTTRSTGLKLSYEKDEISTNIRANHILRTLDNNDALRSQLNNKEDFKAFNLGANFRYRLDRLTSLTFDYDLNNTPPNLDQIQEFEDISDPLNIITGNPDLEPSNNHRLSLRYNKFNFEKKRGISANVDYGFVNNNIVRKTTVNSDLSRRTTYDNVDGNYGFNANINGYKQVKIDSSKSVRYNLGLRGSINKSINFNGDTKYASQNKSFNPSLGVSFSWDNIMEVSPTYRLSYNTTTFDLDSFKDQEFLTHALEINTIIMMSKRFDWRNDVSFNYNANVAPGFQKSSWFWNSTFSYSMFNDKGLLTLKVYDLLGQNTNARRTATENFIQDSQSTILEQYVMLGFSWKLNKMGGMRMDRHRGRNNSYNG